MYAVEYTSLTTAVKEKKKGKPIFQDLPCCYAYVFGGATFPHLLTSFEGLRLPVPSSKNTHNSLFSLYLYYTILNIFCQYSKLQRITQT